jgi:hypothetical protein
VCGDKIHLKRVNNKNYPVKCPLEKYKSVKSFYTPEFKQMLNYTFFDEFPLSNNPEDLKKFSEYIPDETLLSDYVKRYEDNISKEWVIYTRTLIVESSLETFFTHFTKTLIDIYDDNKIHYVDSPQLPQKTQFNYLWLSPTTLRECYFREGRNNSRFKSMTELGNPSLVIYPLGSVTSVPNKSWGEILLDLITHRSSLGRPTWIVKSKDLNSCLEITSSEALRTYLTKSANIPTVQLDPDDLIDTGSINSSNNNTDSGSYF